MLLAGPLPDCFERSIPPVCALAMQTLAPLDEGGDKGEREEAKGPEKVVVVGAGAAGLAAASTLVVSAAAAYQIQVT
jgi:NADPH-dependent 2,4-dienoyl-CoA reductase/sulfur reductase-like enzyme